MSPTEPEVEWPDPQPDPDEEPGEGEFGLLPNRARWQRLTPEQRGELRELVRDWVGDKLERWRREVTA